MTNATTSTISDIARRRIREIRLSRRTEDGRPWSLDTLARRLLELEGVDADAAQVASKRTIVNRLERGERGISLDDLFAYAAALGVSPRALLVVDVPLRLAPGLVLQPLLIFGWMLGTTPLRPEDVEAYEEGEAAYHKNVSTQVGRSRLVYPNEEGVSLYEEIADLGPLSPVGKAAILGYLQRDRRQTQKAIEHWAEANFKGDEMIEFARQAQAALKIHLAEVDEAERRVEAVRPRRPRPRTRSRRRTSNG